MANDNENEGMTPEEIDAIGEILNISMGSGATAISTMLDKQVSITTPTVTVKQFANLELEDWEPAMLVTIRYTIGLDGSNMMVFHKRDIQMIINMLMGIEEEPVDDFEFDELAMSAASEVMNQMMGSSATALSSFFNKKIDISTPEATVLDSSDEFKQILGIGEEENIVSVSFKMTIPGVLDSEFINILRYDLAKTLAKQVVGGETPALDELPAVEAPPAAPQETGGGGSGMMSQSEIEAMMQNSAGQPAPQQQQQQQMPMMDPQMQQMMMQQMMQQMPQFAASPMQQPNYNLQTPQFPEFNGPNSAAGIALMNSNMDLMMSVPLTVSVEIGQTVKKIKDIMNFTQGTIIELEKQAGAPVDIVVNGHLIARGDVVVIEDNFGVRITEIIRTRE